LRFFRVVDVQQTRPEDLRERQLSATRRNL
jgi:hypothetical protein